MRLDNINGRVVGAVLLCGVSLPGLTGCGGDSGPTPESLAITTTSLPDGTINQPYSASLTGSGGAPPYTWSVSPALPVNLSFDTATGAITGTPTTAGTTTHAFTVRDTSAPSQIDTQDFTISVSELLEIATTSLPNATENQPYTTTLQSTGGDPPVSWSVDPALPAGLSLDQATGEISGTPRPMNQGSHLLTFTAQDSRAPPQIVMKQLDLRVDPP